MLVNNWHRARTVESIMYFPRFLFAYFLLFHIYYFSCPFGFGYLAFYTFVSFTHHLILFFVNHYELPALANGQVSTSRPRVLQLRRTTFTARVNLFVPANRMQPPAQPPPTTAPREGVENNVDQPAPT